MALRQNSSTSSFRNIKILFAIVVFTVVVMLLLNKFYIITSYKIVFDKYEHKWAGSIFVSFARSNVI